MLISHLPFDEVCPELPHRYTALKIIAAKTQELLSTLVGTSNEFSDFEVAVTGDPSAFGIFSEGDFGLNSGIVLSTGVVRLNFGSI